MQVLTINCYGTITIAVMIWRLHLGFTRKEILKLLAATVFSLKSGGMQLKVAT